MAAGNSEITGWEGGWPLIVTLGMVLQQLLLLVAGCWGAAAAAAGRGGDALPARFSQRFTLLKRFSRGNGSTTTLQRFPAYNAPRHQKCPHMSTRFGICH